MYKIWRLNNKLLNDEWIKEEIKIFLELNETKIPQQNL